MKITNKLRLAISDAITNATMEAYDYHCSEVKDNPPDTWDEDTRRRWDLIGDVEARISKAVKQVVEPPSAKAPKKRLSESSLRHPKETEGWINVIRNQTR